MSKTHPRPPESQEGPFYAIQLPERGRLAGRAASPLPTLVACLTLTDVSSMIRANRPRQVALHHKL